MSRGCAFHAHVTRRRAVVYLRNRCMSIIGAFCAHSTALRLPARFSDGHRVHRERKNRGNRARKQQMQEPIMFHFHQSHSALSLRVNRDSLGNVQESWQKRTIFKHILTCPVAVRRHLTHLLRDLARPIMMPECPSLDPPPASSFRIHTPSFRSSRAHTISARTARTRSLHSCVPMDRSLDVR